MTEAHFEVLKCFVLPCVIPICSFLYWVYCKIDHKFEKMDQKFEKIDLEIKEIRTSLNRMEGAFYSKECCILKNDDKIKEVK